jgi:hypothetical protein
MWGLPEGYTSKNRKTQQKRAVRKQDQKKNNDGDKQTQGQTTQKWMAA